MLAVFLILFAGVLPAQQDVVTFVLPTTNKPSADTTFEWRPALEQSMRMLMVQHAFRTAAQPKTRRELGGSFFRDYLRSVGSVEGWGDGDNVLLIISITHCKARLVVTCIYKMTLKREGWNSARLANIG